MATIAAIAYATVFLIGCVVGSFLNVCIYRLPRERSVISPPSHCPQCGARLKAIDLVPLLSFLALGRKCRYCGGPISGRYFSVELVTGIIFMTVWSASLARWNSELSWLLLLETVAYWIFVSVVIAVIFTDLDHMIIPDKLVVAAVAAALMSQGALLAAGRNDLLLVQVPGSDLRLPGLIAGGLLGLVAFVFVRAFSQLLFRREGMGLGDVKLAGAIGAMLGPTLALFSFGLAVFAGAVLGVLLIVLRLRRRMEYLPFGPFLAISSLVALLAPGHLLYGAKFLFTRWLGMFEF